MQLEINEKKSYSLLKDIENFNTKIYELHRENDEINKQNKKYTHSIE